MRHFLAIALLTAVSVSLHAQHFSPAHPPAGGGFPRSHHSGNFSRGFYPVSYFDPLDWDYMYPADDSVPAQPSVIVLQPAAAPVAPEPPSPPAHPLLIELQGDRYVEISGDDQPVTQLIEQQPPPATRSQSLAPAPLPQDALLIFRDGHRERISGYTIADGFLYAAANYYTEGTWSRKIELSSLNLTETVRANQSRGINFHLPSASNEVIVGP
jgi:hypothetical protein